MQPTLGNPRAAEAQALASMNGVTDSGRFEVTDHFEVKGRGGFVVGRIVGGVIRPGMLVPTRLEPATLRIAGVEFVDNISARTYRNALIFAEQPSLAFVRTAFPVGVTIEVK